MRKSPRSLSRVAEEEECDLGKIYDQIKFLTGDIALSCSLFPLFLWMPHFVSSSDLHWVCVGAVAFFAHSHSVWAPVALQVAKMPGVSVSVCTLLSCRNRNAFRDSAQPFPIFATLTHTHTLSHRPNNSYMTQQQINMESTRTHEIIKLMRWTSRGIRVCAQFNDFSSFFAERCERFSVESYRRP